MTTIAHALNDLLAKSETTNLSEMEGLHARLKELKQHCVGLILEQHLKPILDDLEHDVGQIRELVRKQIREAVEQKKEMDAEAKRLAEAKRSRIAEEQEKKRRAEFLHQEQEALRQAQEVERKKLLEQEAEEERLRLEALTLVRNRKRRVVATILFSSMAVLFAYEAWSYGNVLPVWATILPFLFCMLLSFGMMTDDDSFNKSHFYVRIAFLVGLCLTLPLLLVFPNFGWLVGAGWFCLMTYVSAGLYFLFVLLLFAF